MPFSSPECIAWLTGLMTESVAIVIFNVLTVIVFMKKRSLRKRSMYLVINLSVADLLVGGFTEIFEFVITGYNCNFWKFKLASFGIWGTIRFGMQLLFLVTSITIITVISLERLHATFRPFRHRVIKQWVYWVVITVTWVTGVSLSTALVVMMNFKGLELYYAYVWSSFNSICLFVICVCYVCIVVKICRGARPQHHGAASRERRLSVTLVIVTLVSLLTWLPHVTVIFLYIATDRLSSLTFVSFMRLNYVLAVLFFANSLVNPLLYTIRMPEFKRALVSLFRRQPGEQVAVIPLHALQVG